LVGIDFAGSDQSVKAHVWILCEDIVDFRGIGLCEQSLDMSRAGVESRNTYNLLIDISNISESDFSFQIKVLLSTNALFYYSYTFDFWKGRLLTCKAP
jgi:hypothetical protein